MYISLKQVQMLFADYPNKLYESQQSYCLTGCIMLDHAPKPYSTHLLYLCMYEELLNTLHVAPDTHLLCLVEDQFNLTEQSEEFSDLNVLFIKNGNLHHVYLTTLEFFSNKCGVALFADSLLDVLFYEGGIQEMINRAYSAFGNPIFVFDSSFNLIAANWEEAQRGNAATALIENKGFSDDEFQMLNSRDHIHEKVQKSEKPIKAYNPELGYDQLLCTIDTQKDLGHIVLSAINQPLRTIDEQLLRVLARCIDQQLKKDEFIRNSKGFNYEYFLRDLLEGKIATEKSCLNRMDYVGSEFSGNMYCVVIETARTPRTLNTSRIRSIFENRFPNSKTLMYNGGIIAILNISNDGHLSKAALIDAAGICQENGLFAGLSNCFQNIIEFAAYYKQALRAIELGICQDDKPNLFLYEDYYLDHVKNIFVQKESPEIFCHPQMKFLLEYDSNHGSELAYTLYMFLTHERNILAASVSMHMHRNSLVYRIKKIKALIDNDFDNYSDRQYLILSYEMNHEHHQ